MTSAPSPQLVPSLGEEEALDPELLDLPDPPKKERSLTVFVLLFTAFASLAMVAALRRDAAYALVDATPADLGDLGAAAPAFAENGYVRATAMLGAAHAIKYERPFVTESFRLMPVAGRPNVWVEVRVPVGAETSRYVPPSQFVGHLVKFDAAGPKHRGLATAIRDATGQRVPETAWLLVDGEAPWSSRWALLLVAMFLGFAAWNIAVTAKLVRRVR